MPVMPTVKPTSNPASATPRSRCNVELLPQLGRKCAG
jgi:hypothetical protein